MFTPSIFLQPSLSCYINFKMAQKFCLYEKTEKSFLAKVTYSEVNCNNWENPGHKETVWFYLARLQESGSEFLGKEEAIRRVQWFSKVPMMFPFYSEHWLGGLCSLHKNLVSLWFDFCSFCTNVALWQKIKTTSKTPSHLCRKLKGKCKNGTKR